MATVNEVQAALDQYAETVLAGENLLFSNQDDQSFFFGSQPYVKMKVVFSRLGQAQLGNAQFYRGTGFVLFTVYERRGVGVADTNRLLELVIHSFRNRSVGPAHLRDAQLAAPIETATWITTAVQVPFYFH